MACSKYNLTNTGSTITTFNYQRCEDALWQYQVELFPNETKNIWLLDNTYSTAFGQFIVLDNYGPFPFTTPTNTPNVTPSPTPSQTAIINPTPTPTNTPTVTQTSSPTPTNTNTPSFTPTSSNTPSITPTHTTTPTPTTNRNLIIENNSSNNYIINLVDASGLWFLTDQVGSFIVSPGQRLYANHGTTDINPRCTITYTGTYNFIVKINGVTTSDWSGSGSAAGLPRVLRTANPALPIDETEIVYILITN